MVTIITQIFVGIRPGRVEAVCKNVLHTYFSIKTVAN